MKNIFILGVVLVMAVAGYFIFSNSDSVGVADKVNDRPATKTVEGVVTAVDRDQVAFDGPIIIEISDSDGVAYSIAIPSMGIQLCPADENIADAFTIAIGDRVVSTGFIDNEGNIVPCEATDHKLQVMTVAEDAVLGFLFTYRKGPDGYITLEDNESTHPDYVTGLTLFNKREYEVLQASTDAREGPPAMHVRIYQNPQKLQASVWAMRNPRESNIELAFAEPDEAVVGGANATFYTTDGLWPLETYVVASGEHVYVLMGAYQEKNDTIYNDFRVLVESFTFIPTEAETKPQAKIDPRVACESALLYTTFPSGEEADIFVAECVDGKHPEVIDRYRSDMGLDGATI